MESKTEPRSLINPDDGTSRWRSRVVAGDRVLANFDTEEGAAHYLVLEAENQQLREQLGIAEKRGNDGWQKVADVSYALEVAEERLEAAETANLRLRETYKTDDNFLRLYDAKLLAEKERDAAVGKAALCDWVRSRVGHRLFTLSDLDKFAADYDALALTPTQQVEQELCRAQNNSDFRDHCSLVKGHSGIHSWGGW